MRRAFEDLRVLDISNSIAGNTCSRLLARHGASAAIVEPTGLSPLRQREPRSPMSEAYGSPLFRHLNAGKAAVALSLDDEQERARVTEWAARSDVVVFDRDVRGWLDPAALPSSVIACQVDDFPTGSAREDWQGSEMVHQALSGAMYVTGSPEREPLYGLSHRAEYAAGVTAYSAVVAALLEREGSGRGQAVSVSVMEAAAATAQNIVTLYGYNGTYQTRREYPGMLSIMKCRDNWVIMFALRQWKGLCETFGVPELIDDERFRRPVDRAANWREADAILAEAASHMVADDLVERAQKRKVSIEKVHTMADLRTAEQLQRRGMIATLDGIARLGPVFRARGDLAGAAGEAGVLVAEDWNGWEES